MITPELTIKHVDNQTIIPLNSITNESKLELNLDLKESPAQDLRDFSEPIIVINKIKKTPNDNESGEISTIKYSDGWKRMDNDPTKFFTYIEINDALIEAFKTLQNYQIKIVITIKKGTIDYQDGKTNNEVNYTWVYDPKPITQPTDINSIESGDSAQSGGETTPAAGSETDDDSTEGDTINTDNTGGESVSETESTPDGNNDDQATEDKTPSDNGSDAKDDSSDNNGELASDSGDAIDGKNPEDPTKTDPASTDNTGEQSESDMESTPDGDNAADSTKTDSANTGTINTDNENGEQEESSEANNTELDPNGGDPPNENKESNNTEKKEDSSGGQDESGDESTSGGGSATGLEPTDKAIELNAGVAVKLGITQGRIKEREGQSVVIASGEKASALEIKVKAKDINGNIVENSNAIVKIGIDNDGRLSCESPCKIIDKKATIELINGIGNFNNLRIEGKEDETYRLTITSEPSMTSTAFFNSFITRAGPASKLIILDKVEEIDGDTLNLGRFEPPKEFTDLKVKVTDSYGNPVENETIIFGITVIGGDLSDTTAQTNKEGIASIDRWKLGDQSGEHQLTASLKDKKVTYIAELYYPASKIVIKEIPTNDQKLKINLGDFIRKTVMEYREEGKYELLSVSGDVKYTEKIDNAVTSLSVRPTRELKLNINKEVDPKNKFFFEELQKNITSREVDLGEDFTLKLDLFNCHNEGKPVIGYKTDSQGGEPGYWTKIEKESGSFISQKNVRTYHISIYSDDYSKYQIPEDYKYETAKPKIKPIYYDCKKEESTIEKTFTAPSMAIESGGTLGPIMVQLTGSDNKAVSDANDQVTVSLNAKTDNKPLCKTDEESSNHCNNEVLSCINNDVDCLNVIADKGIATFNDLVLKGKVGKIYNLQFTSGNLTSTENNHKSQVYINKAGEYSAAKAYIKVEEGKESIIADGESTARITVHLTDDSGNPIMNKVAKLETSTGTFENNKQEIDVKDKGDGSYTATLTSTNADTAIITATVDNQLIKGNASVTFKAGEPHKIEFIDENFDSQDKTNVTNGEAINKHITIQLSDYAGNVIKEEGKRIRACLNEENESPQITGDIEIKTDIYGRATFKNLIISGELNDHHILHFTIDKCQDNEETVKSLPTGIIIDKAGKPAQFELKQNPVSDFTSESSLGKMVNIAIKDSGGNVANLNNQVGTLSITLPRDARAELGCNNLIDLTYSTVVCTKENDKKVVLTFKDTNFSLETVTLAGKIDNHTLEVLMNEFTKEIPIEIKNSGSLYKISIEDKNGEKTKEFEDMIPLIGGKQKNHDNTLIPSIYCKPNFKSPTNSRYIFEDKYENRLREIDESSKQKIKTIWQHDNAFEVTINHKGDILSGENYLDAQFSAGTTGQFIYKLNEQVQTTCKYNTYETHDAVKIILNWPLQKQFSWQAEVIKPNTEYLILDNQYNSLPFDKDLRLDLSELPKRSEYLKISDNNKKFTYEITDSKVEQDSRVTLETFDEFSFAILDENDVKYVVVPFDVEIKLDPFYSKQWYMRDKDQAHIILLREKNENTNINNNINIVILGDNFDKSHSDLTNISSDDSLINTDEERYYYEARGHYPTYNNIPLAAIIGATGWNNEGIIGIAEDMFIKSVRVTDRIIKVTEDGGIRTEVAQSHEISAIDKYSKDDNKTTIFTLAYDLSAEDPLPISSDLAERFSKENSIFVRGAGDGFIKYFEGDERGYMRDGKCISGPNMVNNACPSYDKYCLDNFADHYLMTCQSSATDPRANHPAMINVASINKNRLIDSNSARGSNIWIAAPGKDLTTICKDLENFENENYKNCGSNQITESFSGSNGAAAYTSGIVALMLQNSPNLLTTRDVKYILAQTAKPTSNSGTINKAGYKYSESSGFGTIDVKSAIQMAKNHSKDFLGQQITISENTTTVYKEAKSNLQLARFTSEIEFNTGNDDIFIESIVVKTGFISVCSWCSTYNYGFQYSIILESPDGTKSTLLTPFSTIKYGGRKSFDLEILTNAFYGESIKGKWKLYVQSHLFDNKEPLDSDHKIGGWTIDIYGTKTDISKTTNP